MIDINKKELTYREAKDTIMPFGKYKGSIIEDIFLTDPKYLDFILDTIPLTEKLEEAITKVIIYAKYERK
jgi:hypothetical protein